MSVIYRKILIIASILSISMPVICQETSRLDAADIETALPSNALNNNTSMEGGGSPGSSGENQNDTAHDIVVLWEQSATAQVLNLRQLLSSLSRLGPSTHVGIMGFVEQVTVAQGLISSNQVDQEVIQEILNNPSVGNTVLDLGRALERGIYELKYNGRQAADKIILLISSPGEGGIRPDGIALPMTVGSDVNEFNIKLVAVTFGELAMNHLSRMLNGLQNSTIHIIQNSEELNVILASVLSGNTSSNLQQTTSPIETIEPPQLQQVQTQNQVDTNTSPVVPVVSKEEKTRNIITVIAAGILIITLGALIILLYLRMKKLSGVGTKKISEAFLKDIHGYTSNELYRLGKNATMLGRVAGKDSEDLDYIVIPETTIGRRHAVIEYKDYAYWIIDQGSINGTFVNNIPVTSEVRLKQGDMVRLHKFEFEFSIPELDEAGMTKVSNTVMAEHHPEKISLDSPEVDEVKENISSDGLDLDLGFGDGIEGGGESVESISNETLLPGHDVSDGTENDSENETLMPDVGKTDSVHIDLTGGDNPVSKDTVDFESPSDDETLMPGTMGEVDDEDETIRPGKKTSDD